MTQRQIRDKSFLIELQLTLISGHVSDQVGHRVLANHGSFGRTSRARGVDQSGALVRRHLLCSVFQFGVGHVKSELHEVEPAADQAIVAVLDLARVLDDGANVAFAALNALEYFIELDFVLDHDDGRLAIAQDVLTGFNCVGCVDSA